MENQLEERARLQRERWQKVKASDTPPVVPLSVPRSEALPLPQQWQSNNSARTQQPRYSSVHQQEPGPAGTSMNIDLGYTNIEIQSTDFQERPCRNACLLMWCPCCLGNPCGSQHVADMRAASTWFISIVTIVDISVFCLELIVAATSPHGFDGLAPSTCILGSFGGVFAPLIVNRHQLQRLILPVFLHGGFFHILMNMYVQLLMGLRFEAKWGFKFTAMVYLLSGVGGCLLSAVGSPFTVGVGASGAIVGLVAAQAAELAGNWYLHEETVRQKQAGQLAFFFLILFMFGAGDVHVDNYAHVGGLITGLLIGFYRWGDGNTCFCSSLGSHLSAQTWRRVFFCLGCFQFALLSFFLFSSSLPDMTIHC